MKNPNNKAAIFLFSQKLQAVNHILTTWGAFTLLESGGNLNFLPKNTLEILGKFGIKLDATNQSLQWPSLAEQADKLINQLAHYKPKWAETIKWHYMQAGTIRDKAKQFGLFKSTYHDRLCKGQHWIAQQLRKTLH